MTCLLLGANGYLGKALAGALAGARAPAHSLRGFDLAPQKAPALPPALDYRQGDFTRCADFGALLAGVDVVFHLISTTLPGPETDGIPQELTDNVLPTLRLLEAVVRGGCRTRVVFVSSGGTVYGDTAGRAAKPGDATAPICAYGMQKKVIEDYLAFYGRVHGLDWRVARLTNPYGFGQDPGKPQGLIPILIHRLLRDEPVALYGNTRRDYLYMDDAMDALVRLAGYRGAERVFNVASGETHALEEVAALIIKAIGKPGADIRRFPARPFDLADTRLDISLTTAELGWAPRTPLREGIQKLVARAEQV